MDQQSKLHYFYFSFEINHNIKRYIIFKYGLDSVIIQQKLFSFGTVLELMVSVQIPSAVLLYVKKASEYSLSFSVWIQNRLIYEEFEPVLKHTEK